MGQIIITLENEDKVYEYDALSVNFDSSPEEILAAVQPVVLENFGVNIKGEGDTYLYTVKKAQNSQNVYLYPKSPAGDDKGAGAR